MVIRLKECLFWEMVNKIIRGEKNIRLRLDNTVAELDNSQMEFTE